jgi:DNA-binding MarR family transcriptional regulator
MNATENVINDEAIDAVIEEGLLVPTGETRDGKPTYELSEAGKAEVERRRREEFAGQDFFILDNFTDEERDGLIEKGLFVPAGETDDDGLELFFITEAGLSEFDEKAKEERIAELAALGPKLLEAGYIEPAGVNDAGETLYVITEAGLAKSEAAAEAKQAQS